MRRSPNGSPHCRRTPSYPNATRPGFRAERFSDIAEIFEDEQYRARGALEAFEDERVGKLVIPAGMPKMSETPPSTRSLGAALGRDTEEILSRILKIDKPTIESSGKWR